MLDSLAAFNTVPVTMARSRHLKPALESERAAPRSTAPLDPASLPDPRDAEALTGAPPQQDGGFSFAPFSTGAPVGFGAGLDVQENVWGRGPSVADFQAASRAYQGPLW